MSDRSFEYLLNTMERAAQEANPAEHDYAAKRKAVFDYVRRLEVIEREAKVLADCAYDAQQLATAIQRVGYKTRNATAEDY